MKTILTNQDIKNLFTNAFKNHSENVLLTEEAEDGETQVVDLYEYMSMTLYAWKNRLVEVNEQYSEYGAWTESIDFSINQTYGLVETESEEVAPSQDLDNVTKFGAITFLVPTNKVQNLEYFVLKLRNIYSGQPEKIQNRQGVVLTTYIALGGVVYSGEPEMTPYGEIIECKVDFSISYLNECFGYYDTECQISFNGDDLYDAQGNIVDENGDPTSTKYLTMPILQSTWQNIFTTDSVPLYERANKTGAISKGITMANTISFFDFNQTLTNKINDYFWELTAERKNGILQEKKDTNVPVYFRIIWNGNNYTYRLVVTNMEKIIKNGEPTITSLSVKTYGKGV